jgi:hypothetical protein
VGKPGPIDRPGPRSCALALSPSRELGARRRERSPRWQRDLPNRECFGAKHEPERQLEAHRPPGDVGASAGRGRVPRLSIRVPDVVVDQGG